MHIFSSGQLYLYSSRFVDDRGNAPGLSHSGKYTTKSDRFCTALVPEIPDRPGTTEQHSVVEVSSRARRIASINVSRKPNPNGLSPLGPVKHLPDSDKW